MHHDEAFGDFVAFDRFDRVAADHRRPTELVTSRRSFAPRTSSRSATLKSVFTLCR
jgi:hypothetical protein